MVINGVGGPRRRRPAEPRSSSGLRTRRRSTFTPEICVIAPERRGQRRIVGVTTGPRRAVSAPARAVITATGRCPNSIGTSSALHIALPRTSQLAAAWFMYRRAPVVGVSLCTSVRSAGVYNYRCIRRAGHARTHARTHAHTHARCQIIACITVWAVYCFRLRLTCRQCPSIFFL